MATGNRRFSFAHAQLLLAVLALLCLGEASAWAEPVRLVLESEALPAGYRFAPDCPAPSGDWFGALASERRPTVFRGLNRMIWIDEIHRCGWAQLLAHGSQPKAELERLRGAWLISPVADDVAHPGPDNTRPSHPSSPPPRSNNESNPIRVKKTDTDWYYIDTDTITDALSVKLPAGSFYCAKPDQAGVETYTIEKNVADVTIDVSADAKSCGPAVTHQQAVHRLNDDAALLTAQDRTDLNPRLRPAGSPRQVVLELHGKFTSQDHYTDVNIPNLKGLRLVDQRWSSEVSLFLFEANHALTPTELAFDLTVDSLASAKLAEKVPLLNPTTGKAFKDAAGNLPSQFALRVKKWNLGEPNLYVTVGVAPDSDTQIAIPSVLWRFLAAKKPLKCGATTGCAFFDRRDSGEGFITLNSEDARKTLSGTEKTLAVSIERDDGITLQSDAGTPITLTLQTDDCRFQFQQLTGVVGGTQGAQALYSVRATPARCACDTFKLEALETTDVVVRTSEFIDGLTAATCREGSRDEPAVRVLSVTFSTLTQVEAGDYNLQAKLGLGSDAQLAKTTDGLGHFPLRVERGFNKGDIKVAIDTTVNPDNPTEIASPLHVLASRSLNRVVIPRAATVPWEISLTHLGNHTPELPPELHREASIFVNTAPRALNVASFDGNDVYFIRAPNPSEDDLPLVASITGIGAQFVLSSNAEVTKAPLVQKALEKSITLGSTNVAIPGGKTRPLLLPWDLRNSALVCGNDHYNMKRGFARQPFMRGDLTECFLRIAVPPGVHGDLTAQRIKLSITKNTETTSVPLDLIRYDPGSSPPESLEFKVGNILEKVGEVTDYTQLTFHAQHVPDEELEPSLKVNLTPDDLQHFRQEPLDVRLLVIPDWSYAPRNAAGHIAYGARFYGTGAAGISLVRTRNKGFVQTSSDYNKQLGAQFSYGGLLVAEPWNFSENQPVIPYFAPQASVGVLGPTDFNTPRWWNGFSFVAGVGLRLPAARSADGKVSEAQTGVVAWYEVTRSARDEWIDAILFGFNVSIGSLSP